MPWFFRYFWLIAATQPVIVAVLRDFEPFYPKPKPPRKELMGVALRSAAISFPLLYLLHAFLEGLHGKGWGANLL